MKTQQCQLKRMIQNYIDLFESEIFAGYYRDSLRRRSFETPSTVILWGKD